MNKEYSPPDFEVTVFEVDDIITISGHPRKTNGW